MQNRLASAGLWGLRERSVQVGGQQRRGRGGVGGSLHNANFCIKHMPSAPTPGISSPLGEKAQPYTVLERPVTAEVPNKRHPATGAGGLICQGRRGRSGFAAATLMTRADLPRLAAFARRFRSCSSVSRSSASVSMNNATNMGCMVFLPSSRFTPRPPAGRGQGAAFMALACPGGGKGRKRRRSQAQVAKVPDLWPGDMAPLQAGRASSSARTGTGA